MPNSNEAETIRGLPLFSRIPEDTRVRLAEILRRVSKPVSYRDGDALISQRALGGQDGFVLLQGEVRVEKEGAEPIVLRAPALLGEMLQFNPRGQRTATVRAQGNAVALRFAWQEFYAQAKQALSEREQDALLEAIERSVSDRLDPAFRGVDLPLFRGLPDRLNLRACLALQWVVQRMALTDGQELFARDDLTGGTGFILVHGQVELTRPHYPPQVVRAPEVIGVIPRFDPARQWTATATARGSAELLRFNWQDYMALLQRRLSREELEQFVQVVESNATERGAF